MIKTNKNQQKTNKTNASKSFKKILSFENILEFKRFKNIRLYK